MKLLHFTAEWCQPCKMMKPIISELIKEHPNVEYAPIDIDEHPETAIDYGVMGVPAFIMMDDEGNILHRTVGAMPKAEFAARIGFND